MSGARRDARPVGRRAFLRGAAGAVIGLPWLEALAPRGARAAGPAPLRFVVMFSPNGTLPDRWTPTGGETDFVLSPILAPLDSHRGDVVIVHGLFQQGGGGDAHQNGIGGMLTGNSLNPGSFGTTPSGWAAGPSVDQRVAAELGGATRLRSLELGVQVGPADNWGRMCYRAANQPLPPAEDPAAVYASVFGDLHTDAASLARLRARRRSILDAVGNQYARLSARLGAADRLRLDAHLTAVREVETSLTAQAMISNPSCHDPALTSVDPSANDSFPTVGAQQMDLLVMALACDVTRVASLQWSRSVSETRFTWLPTPITEGHHTLSHQGDDDTTAVDKLTRINSWYAQQFAGLLSRMAAVPDGDGRTLLDNSLVLWCNELAKGNTHSRADAPYVLAGRAGGALRTGRFLDYEGMGLPHNNLLVSLLNAMGIADQSFGKPEWCTGPLVGLL